MPDGEGVRLGWRRSGFDRRAAGTLPPRAESFRQRAFGKLRRFGAAPAARALAAEAAIGQQRKAAFTGSPPAAPTPAHRESRHQPQAGAGAKFQARHGMPLAGAAQPVHRRAPADRGAERSRPARRHQAFAGAIHAPRVSSSLPPAPATAPWLSGTKRALFQRTRAPQRRRLRRPDGPRRHHEADFPQKGKHELKETAGSPRAPSRPATLRARPAAPSRP
jgi:hypothetical protein